MPVQQAKNDSFGIKDLRLHMFSAGRGDGVNSYKIMHWGITCQRYSPHRGCRTQFISTEILNGSFAGIAGPFAYQHPHRIRHRFAAVQRRGIVPDCFLDMLQHGRLMKRVRWVLTWRSPGRACCLMKKRFGTTSCRYPLARVIATYSRHCYKLSSYGGEGEDSTRAAVIADWIRCRTVQLSSRRAQEAVVRGAILRL
jgi:hypothetical protein